MKPIAVKALQRLRAKDPTFNVGETHTAKATLTNNTGQSLTCTTELYIDVTKVATSGVSQPFTLPAGGSIDVSYVVPMPSSPGGPYHVYIDVSSGGTVIAHYQATEDVTIAKPPVTIDDFQLLLADKSQVKVTITNNTGQTLVNAPSSPSGQKYVSLNLYIYSAQQFTVPPLGASPAQTFDAGFQIAYIQLEPTGGGIASLPPGTTTWTITAPVSAFTNIFYDPSASLKHVRCSIADVVPEGLAGLAWLELTAGDSSVTPGAIYVDAHAGFKGIYSFASMQQWGPTSIVVENVPVPYVSYVAQPFFTEFEAAPIIRLSNLTVSPGNISGARGATSGPAETVTITVTNIGNATFSDTITFDCLEYSYLWEGQPCGATSAVSITLAPGASQTLNVTFHPGEMPPYAAPGATHTMTWYVSVYPTNQLWPPNKLTTSFQISYIGVS